MADHDRVTATTPQTEGQAARERLLAGVAVEERRLEVAGIDTAVLEGGSGPAIVLLHDPSEHAAKWFRVLPDLLATHHVVAPDLPGHGSSGGADGPLDADRVLDWLGELIEATCTAPPSLVGLILGGGIAARFAIERPHRLDRLVLVDALGLVPLAPAPEFGQALQAYLTEPTAQTHDELWQYCAYDLDGLRNRLGGLWEPFTAAGLHRTRTPFGMQAVQQLMGAFGMAAIPPEDLAGIVVPTALIWGRHDLATPVEVAADASRRYGWTLHVIDDSADDPAMEQPEAFVRALRVALGRTVTVRSA